MGTRALIHIKEDKKTIMTVYRQYDGYPSGLGKDIFEALGSRKLVNGYSEPKEEINGIGCAAALLVAHLKRDGNAGNVYIMAPNAKDCWEEYTYTLSVQGDFLHLKCVDSEKKIIYSGLLNDFMDHYEFIKD